MYSENPPILAAIIPTFELFSSAWEAMKADGDLAEENVASIITPGLDLARKYYEKLEASNPYIIAMCVIRGIFGPSENGREYIRFNAGHRSADSINLLCEVVGTAVSMQTAASPF
ncbi:hypothetical protein K438DRAFT_1750376 [Mycena galopus ATCC 62051]|nr:hypothetical protein K438DRAFT_1750376 [Mycena galopus ATCC 62051]